MLRNIMQPEDIPSLLEFSIDVNESVALCGKDSAPPPLALRDKENVDMNNTLDNPSIGKPAAASVLSPTPPMMTPPSKGSRPRPRTTEGVARQRSVTTRSNGTGNLMPPLTSRSAIHEDVPRSERRIPPRPKSVGGQAKRDTFLWPPLIRAPTNIGTSNRNCDISLLSSYRVPSPCNSSAMSGDSRIITSTAPTLSARPSSMRPTISDLAQKGHEVCTCGASKIWERIRARHVAELQEAKKVKQSAAKIREEARALEREKLLFEEQMQHFKCSREDLQKQKQRVQEMWEDTKRMQEREGSFKSRVAELETQMTRLLAEKKGLQQEVEDFRMDGEVLRADVEHSNAEAAKWKKQVDILEEQACDCAAKLSAVEVQQKALKAQEAKWIADLKANKEEVKKAEAAVEDATKRLNDQASALRQGEERLALAKEELALERKVLAEEGEACKLEHQRARSALEDVEAKKEELNRLEAAMKDAVVQQNNRANELDCREAALA
ncbi:hypothetical protein FOZ60_005803 [Perkinsus olseni]|uniref:Uncharacterized protein n=1 Tax=Perkinsus olseni TaxID=32597 RepID=A0A7J6PH50_PEROL|nr:hypothetical protein FOZ60_005803 [Perkinsus olseni]